MKSAVVLLIISLGLVLSPESSSAGNGHGLLGKYYAHVDILEVSPGIWDATFDDADLAFTRIDPIIHFYFGDTWVPEEYSWSPIDQIVNDTYAPWFDPEGVPYIAEYGNEYYGVKWSGYIVIPSAGWYEFGTVADDGSKIFIDDIQILNVGRNWFAPLSSGPIELDAGFHKIDVIYWEMTRWDGIRLMWDQGTNSVDWTVVPQELLYPAEPCDIEADWKNHGQFVRCVAHEVNALLDMGALTQDEADIIVSEATQSGIGK